MSKRWKSRKRKPVVREERCEATPETLAKLKPWTMQELLRRGPEKGGLTSQQFEAALQIVDAFDVITRGLGYRPLDLGRIGGGGDVEMSPRDVRLWMIYIAFGEDYQRRTMVRPHTVVEWVKDERTIDAGAVVLIARAADMWERQASDYDRARRAK